MPKIHCRLLRAGVGWGTANEYAAGSGQSSVVMQVVSVGDMRVRVPLGLVLMAVAVLADKLRIVNVFVMAVAVPMGVLVLQRFVLMLMAMRLGQVQHHAGEHQHAAERHQPTR